MRHVLVTLAVVFVTQAGLAAQANQHPPMPAGMTHEAHLRQLEKDAELKQRGAEAMGFDQDATTHHFRLSDEGGAVEVTANDPSDSAVVAQVRSHLRDIAVAFAAGDFGKPFATHGEQPPGVPVMQQRRAAIAYAYEELAAGGRVRITTRDGAALAAVHEFLRYQIREHATGDPLDAAP